MEMLKYRNCGIWVSVIPALNWVSDTCLYLTWAVMVNMKRCETSPYLSLSFSASSPADITLNLLIPHPMPWDYRESLYLYLYLAASENVLRLNYKVKH